MPNSRLTRRSSKQGKRQLYWSVAGIVIIIFLALNIGPIFLAASGNLIDNIIGKSGQSGSITESSDLKHPILEPLPKATSESELDIKGTAFYSEGQIELYVNGLNDRSVKLNSQDFSINSVSLKPGINIIKAKIVQGDRESDFSESFEISYIKDKPRLEIERPADGQRFEKSDQEIEITGTTDPDNSIRVNSFIAIVNSSGNFIYNIRLNEGENKLKIIATNAAGIDTEKEITVFYSP